MSDVGCFFYLMYFRALILEFRSQEPGCAVKDTGYCTWKKSREVSMCNWELLKTSGGH